ncbi:MAG: hypothetical protein JWO82_3695 [Akkermansiaceae bacterium]|nr:hypothetical protein [Akkermansiaceae bacterium]
MTRFALLATSFLLGAAPAFAVSDSVKAPLANLVAAMRDELKAGAAPEANGRPREDSERKYALNALLENSTDERLALGLQGASRSFTSQPVLDAVEKLRGAIEADQAAREAAVVKAHQALIQKVRDAVAAAKVPADLDPVLTLLDLPNADNNSEVAQSRNQQLNDARRFVTRWQDYLAAVQEQSPEKVLVTLQNLNQEDGNRLSIVPRSTLLKIEQDQTAKQPDFGAWIVGIKSLDDIAAVSEKVRRLNRDSSPSGNEAQLDALESLTVIDKIYRAYLAGAPFTLEIDSHYSTSQLSSEVFARIAELKVMLLRQVLPRYIEAPAGTVPKADETPVDFLNRVTAEARNSGDPRLALRARDAKRALVHSYGSGDDPYAIQGYLAAQNQEAAGQFSLAVASYQQALKSGSDLISPEVIGKRLEAIKSAHPEEYQRGLDAFLKPAVIMSPPTGPPASANEEAKPKGKPAGPGR